MTKRFSSAVNSKIKSKRKISRNDQTKKKSQYVSSENERIPNEQNGQFSFNISNLVATNQEEINSGSFPSYEPPSGWKKLESNDFSMFDFENVHKEEKELWLFKIPPTVSKTDLQGLTLKLPIGLSRVPTKVATIQKESELMEYHVYEMPNDNDISQENEIVKEFIQELRSPHETVFGQMKELEIFLPCKEAQGLLLSHKRPTRYFNICRPANSPDPSPNVDSILAHKLGPIPHPSETFIQRYTVSFPDYSQRHMIEAREAKKKFRNRMMNDWNFPKWEQQIKHHEKIVERTYKEYQKKCKIVVNKSKKKFTKEAEEKQSTEKTKGEKRKSSNNSTEDDFDISTSSSSSENEEKPYKKTRILADLKRQFKRKKVEESDIDSEILEEVAEEEAALVKLAKNQIYRRKQAVKEAQEAEKRAAKTWSPALVSYPIYKPPETWWYKTYNKILNETEQTKLRPKLTKRKYTLEERLKYYKRNGREPPLYVVPKTRGKRIEINYDGIEENFGFPKPRQKKVLPPPPPGTTGHLRPCVKVVDS
ncbi:uncharacterized protein OCT59_018190 [Rhizophagus irregularis]|uniref:Uncharacterized protein n=2 Tax=Rhizophagus irregularis TaxID=588596 RepID=A0A916DX11_9GLOM|nr:hypothetical protein RirG_158480 [Rhizophagus irregularis DAOM 197198w]UZO25936.1 hypothetical protein OCT59_018190 [Rhizophagus irregularis]GBC41833.1 hypothetical protein GLOIN_2v1684463 [Rhizophagus irregularis DAOM 181602=DAOM 197198]CAB4476153.1 unnamed protein product [Rhizophagus irregularis]CAB5132210.1 unnamed protein product [Rhizophagus irregularis]